MHIGRTLPTIVREITLTRWQRREGTDVVTRTNWTLLAYEEEAA